MRSLSLASVALALSGHVIAFPRGVDRAHVLNHRQVQPSYDYVIVGGGTAGLTLADRLTEDGKTTVLVIEYGEISDSTRISTVQGGFQGIDSRFMYSITSVPQVNLRNRTTSVLAGKVVGGSSAINVMMTIRGTTEDYDRWGGFFGPNSTSTWTWAGMLPYFRKALNFVPPLPDVTRSSEIVYDTAFWGNTSGVYAGWPSFQYPATKAQVDAYRDIPGVTFPRDSGAGQTGVYWYPTFMDPYNVTRSYARTGHYENVKNARRDNYHLLAGFKVTKVVLEGKRAVGVTYVPAPGSAGMAAAPRTPTTVRATKEVIVSAGGVHSPQVLQLSGLGPKTLLDAAKIETVVDLPGVGQNFQDHPMLTAAFSFRNFNFRPSSSDLTSNATFRNWAQSVWNLNKTGPYSIASGNAAAWLSYPVISPRYLDVSTRLAAQDPAAQLPVGTHPTVVAGYGAQMASYAAALRSNGTAFYNAIIMGGASSGALVDLHPLSRGTVNIDLRDPTNLEPVVDYRALTNPLDKVIMGDIIRFARRYYTGTETSRRYQGQEMTPGARVTSDADMDAYLTGAMSPTEYHPAGTCAMMPLELGGVVNQELKVYGTEGLRVVDASIIPTLPGANTCQTVYAIAEKAADIIKAAASVV